MLTERTLPRLRPRAPGCHPRGVTLRAPIGRRAAPVAAMATGATVAIIGAVRPWIRTGGRARNSFDVFRLVDDLGVAPDGPAAAVIRWWPVVPLVMVLGVVAAWWGWARVGGVVGVLGALYAGAVATVVLAAPTRGRVLGRGVGPSLTAVGAVVLLAGAIAVLVVGAGVSRPTDPAPAAPSAGGSAGPS